MRRLFSLSLWMMTCLLAPSAFAVLGGSPVATGTYNQTVALVYQADPSAKGKIFCSGTLIGPHTVLTAAHCLVTPMNDNIPVGEELIPKLGVYLGDSPSQSEIPYVTPTSMVAKAYVHSAFTAESKDLRGQRNNDFALLELKNNVDLSKYNIVPSPLRANLTSKSGEKISFIAFGMTDSSKEKGLKRQGTFDIGNLDPFHFSFHSLRSGLSLWHGDSGGSAYLQDTVSKKTYFVGVATFVANGASYFQSFDDHAVSWIKSFKDPLFE